MNLLKKFRVEPGSNVDLGSIDPAFHGHYTNDAEAAQDLQRHLARITELQRKLYADRTHSLLIVLQGIDSAGKDGTCWHVISAMDPQGVQVTGFKQPTPEEQEHDFLWRIHPHAPRRGYASIFNRSHYEDVLVVRVHKLAPKEVWKPRYDYSKILPLYLQGRAAEALQGASRRSGAPMEDQRERLFRARKMG
jgi:polyphosphate kinase 2 (PPK2 family)